MLPRDVGAAKHTRTKHTRMLRSPYVAWVPSEIRKRFRPARTSVPPTAYLPPARRYFVLLSISNKSVAFSSSCIAVLSCLLALLLPSFLCMVLSICNLFSYLFVLSFPHSRGYSYSLHPRFFVSICYVFITSVPSSCGTCISRPLVVLDCACCTQYSRYFSHLSALLFTSLPAFFMPFLLIQ